MATRNSSRDKAAIGIDCKQSMVSRLVQPIFFFVVSQVMDLRQYPAMAGKQNQWLDVLIQLSIYSMLRDKGARIPATLAGRRIGLAFRGGSDQRIGIRDLLGSVHFDVWPCKPVVTLAFEIYEQCPGLSWQVAFLAVFFASVDFMTALRARVMEVARLQKPTLRAIFLAAVRGQTQHVAKWFGSGHSWVRLQSNKLQRLGRMIARQQLLKQLDEVDAAGMQNLTWKRGAAWRRKADIFAELRRCPNVGVFQVTQLWLFLASWRSHYPRHLDAEYAVCGPGARRGMNWLQGMPPNFCNTGEAVQTHQFFLFGSVSCNTSCYHTRPCDQREAILMP